MSRVVYLGAAEGYEAVVDTLAGVAEAAHVAAEPAAVVAALAEADALLDASMRVRITDEMVRAAPDLAIISCATTGSDHIERAALAERGVPVRTLREDPEVLQNLTPAAEHSWALLMACARRLPAALRHVIDGGWIREQFPAVMLNGRCLGLVGCGRIGSWMARYAHAFGMEVIGYDPHLAAFPATIRPVPIEEIFSRADFVSIHVPLSPETEGLVSRALIARMKPAAFLINTSRGAIIDEAALLDALETQQLAGAGLDVLVGEPDTAKLPLVEYAKTHSNLLITPHCGGFSPDAVRVVCRHAAGKIRAVLEGRAG